MSLRHYAWSDAIQESWKSYPVRVRGARPSKCCGRRTLLVQSMEGGFVTANCSRPGCNEKAMFSETDFEALELWVSCAECRSPMRAAMVDKNYAYVCDNCSLYVRLADLLPMWTDVAPQNEHA